MLVIPVNGEERHAQHTLDADAIGVMFGPGGLKQRAYNRVDLLLRLSALRKRIECEMEADGGPGISADQVAMLIDVCEALGFCEAETHYVTGPAYVELMDNAMLHVINVPRWELSHTG